MTLELNNNSIKTYIRYSLYDYNALFKYPQLISIINRFYALASLEIDASPLKLKTSKEAVDDIPSFNRSSLIIKKFPLDQPLKYIDEIVCEPI